MKRENKMVRREDVAVLEDDSELHRDLSGLADPAALSPDEAEAARRSAEHEDAEVDDPNLHKWINQANVDGIRDGRPPMKTAQGLPDVTILADNVEVVEQTDKPPEKKGKG